MATKQGVNGYRITAVEQKTVRDPVNGASQEVIRVSFSIGENGPYYIDVDPEKVDAVEMKKRVEERVHAIQQLLTI